MRKRKTKYEVQIRFSKLSENEKQKAKFKFLFQCHAKTKNVNGIWIPFSHAIEKRLALRYTHSKRCLTWFFFFMSDFSIYHVEVVSISLEGKLPTTDHQGISEGTSRAVFRGVLRLTTHQIRSKRTKDKFRYWEIFTPAKIPFICKCILQWNLYTKIRLTMLCLSCFELCSRWVSLFRVTPAIEAFTLPSLLQS